MRNLAGSYAKRPELVYRLYIGLREVCGGKKTSVIQTGSLFIGLKDNNKETLVVWPLYAMKTTAMFVIERWDTLHGPPRPHGPQCIDIGTISLGDSSAS